MAIPKLPTVKDELALVYSDDPDVSVERLPLRWIPRNGATAVQPTADIVTVRGLNCDERMRCMDTGEKQLGFMQWAAFARAGVLAVNGAREADKIGEWFDRCPEAPIIALGQTIYAITNGIDLEEAARDSAPKSDASGDAEAEDVG
jgi:hypothetical protein